MSESLRQAKPLINIDEGKEICIYIYILVVIQNNERDFGGNSYRIIKVLFEIRKRALTGFIEEKKGC